MRRGQVLRRPARGSIVVLVGLLACAPAPAATPTFTAQGSAEQVYVTGLPADATMSLLSSSGATIATQSSDSLGGLLFRNVAPGNGYRVQLSSAGEKSAPITVHSDAAAPWDPSIYNQTISDNGYQYLTTRDGTNLAIDVHPPNSPAGEPGPPSMFTFPTFPRPGVPSPTYTTPYPTLIEYSGYGYADPAGP